MFDFHLDDLLQVSMPSAGALKELRAEDVASHGHAGQKAPGCESKTSVSLKGSRYFSFHTFYHLARSVCFVVALFFQGGFLYLYVQVGVCEREADVQARQRYHLVCLIDIVHPSPMLFAVYLHF